MNNIVNMAQRCRDMLKRAMDAVENHDTDLAYAIGEEDEKIDQLEDETVDDLVNYMCKNADIVTRGTHLLWIVHSLERIGDRSTNIAERVIFMTTGKILDLNPSKLPDA
jgi:phosphate transport system protein